MMVKKIKSSRIVHCTTLICAEKQAVLTIIAFAPEVQTSKQ
jgi:hypothetical protein